MSVQDEFLKRVSDYELVQIYHEEGNGKESLLWKLCDKHDEEFGGDILLDEMFASVRDEIIVRFAAIVLNSNR